MAEIHFSNDPGKSLQGFLQKKPYSKICVVADHNTIRDCYPSVEKNLPHHVIITVPAGEENKNLRTCELIWTGMTNSQLDRHSVMIVLGGGVLGDMAGFCAATFKRGIDFILVPTTLLSQVDASIGGKLGIDFNDFKNHIGVFHEPALTILYSGFLKTLPVNEIRSGFAEVIKHALISDKSMWNRIRERSLEDQPWNELIRHSVEFKSKIVEADPKEKGLRKILNAGHTIGHAIETHLLSGGRKVMHGEAIAAGLIAEGFLAKQERLLPDSELSEIESYITSVFKKLDIRNDDLEAIAKLTSQDKKNRAGKVLCVFLEGIGKCRFDCEIDQDQVQEALRYYQSIQI